MSSQNSVGFYKLLLSTCTVNKIIASVGKKKVFFDQGYIWDANYEKSIFKERRENLI